MEKVTREEIVRVFIEDAFDAGKHEAALTWQVEKKALLRRIAELEREVVAHGQRGK